jgi:hypothetical protein
VERNLSLIISGAETFSDLRIEFYAKWIEFMGEHDIDPDQTGHLQNFENSFWFRLVRVGFKGFFVAYTSGGHEGLRRK